MATLQMLSLGRSGRTFYVPSPSNVGLWDGPAGMVFIDSGNDADAGRKILRLAEESGRKSAAVFITHSNADHMGGAAFLSSRASIPVYASRIESALCADPVLEPSFVWGAFPPEELRNKFFMAPSVAAEVLPEDGNLPSALAGAEIVPLPGHFFSQRGLLADGVLFAGDALFGPRSIAKHPFFFLYDVAAFLRSLDLIVSLAPALVLPGHGDPAEDVSALVAANREAVERSISVVLDSCRTPASFEDILASVSARFGITLDWAQYALVGSTVRSFLVYLRGEGLLTAGFPENRMVWTRL